MKGQRGSPSEEQKEESIYIYIVVWGANGISEGVSRAAEDNNRAFVMQRRFWLMKKSNRMMRCSRTVGLLGLSRLTRKSVRVMKCLIPFEGPFHKLTDCKGCLRHQQFLKGRLGYNVKICFFGESDSMPFDVETPQARYLKQWLVIIDFAKARWQ